jgi:hypothetical protein
MRVLVYKRTHSGDPDTNGVFGVNDCMGMVRRRVYDAVIGVGGIGSEAVDEGIAGKVTWVGIGPHKTFVRGKRGPEVTFDHFLYHGINGPDFREKAPVLAERMYAHNIRSIIEGLTAKELAEAMAIVQLAADALPSPGLAVAKRRAKAIRRCRPRPSARQYTHLRGKSSSGVC